MTSETITTPAVEIHERAQFLLVEGALAEVERLSADAAHVAYLDAEITATRNANVGTAATDSATLRGQLSARLLG